jgi:hypothetical protein
MSGRRVVGSPAQYEQLTLALYAHPGVHSFGSSAIGTHRTPVRPERTPHERRAAHAEAIRRPSRVRNVPSRDARGRFVAYPTMIAPSWYVFCCGSYRIPGEAKPATPAALVTANAPAKARKPRLRIRRGDIESLALAFLILLASVCYRLHLALPDR